jgi:precorrin-4/cobalt-precorrin-4 C11-methyltransferase
MSGKLYIIGCGPGDRKLITLKGEEALKKSDIIFHFPPYEEIFSDILHEKQIFFYFDFTFNEIKQIIEENILKDKNIAFMVPGDLSLFSPFSSFINFFKDYIEVVPGISTFNYFAAKIKKILNPPDNIYSVTILGPKILHDKIGQFDFSDFVNNKSTLIIYMNDMTLKELLFNLKKIYSLDISIYIGINLSTNKERIYSGTLFTIENEMGNIDLSKEKLTTVIVGNLDEIPFNIEWWDDKIQEYNNKKF